MTLHAEADGDGWRALGRREGYESMVAALGSQLEQLERSARLPNELDHAKKDRP